MHINYRKQVNVVIFDCKHTVPWEETSIAKKPADNPCSVLPLLKRKKEGWNAIVIQIWRSSQSDYRPQDVVEAHCWQWFPWVVLFQSNSCKKNGEIFWNRNTTVWHLLPLCITKQLDGRFWAKLVKYWLFVILFIHGSIIMRINPDKELKKNWYPRFRFSGDA